MYWFAKFFTFQGPEKDESIKEEDLCDAFNANDFNDDDRLEEFSREKHLSKTKKVKNYLKKCKSTANNYIQKSDLSTTKVRKAVEHSVPHTSWYVTDEFYSDEEAKNHVTIVQITDAAKDSVQVPECDDIASVHLASVELDAEVTSNDHDSAIFQPNRDDEQNNNVECPLDNENRDASRLDLDEFMGNMASENVTNDSQVFVWLISK